jgi:hypothetical protein
VTRGRAMAFERGEVTVEAGGVTYRLRMGINGMCAVEDALSTPETPVTFIEFSARLIKMRTIDMRLFAWAALREYHPNLTLEDAGRLIDQVGLAVFSDKLMEMQTGTLPADADVKALGVAPPNGRPQTARPVGTGGPSTSTRGRLASPEPSSDT